MTCIMTGNSQWWLEKKNYGHPSETKLWLICGYHGLTIVTMFFFWGGGCNTIYTVLFMCVYM